MASSRTDTSRIRSSDYVSAIVGWVEEQLAQLELPGSPEKLYEPIRYVLSGGGKRLRPALVLLAAEAFGGVQARKNAMPAALAVEIFHNFTLVHDDIMDHADTRRGRATVHLKWDEPTAILSGDLMMGMAYEQLARIESADTAQLIRIFHRMVEKLCEGQTLDMVFESEADVSVDAYIGMIDAKTGALIEAALDLGATIGGADETQRATLREAGQEIGRAFQIQDDLLDLTADHAKWGKVIGGDLMEGKKAYLLLTALETATDDDLAFFSAIVENEGLEPSQVDDARNRMASIGVLDRAAHAVKHHLDNALGLLAHMPENTASTALEDLVRTLMGRER